MDRGLVGAELLPFADAVLLADHGAEAGDHLFRDGPPAAQGVRVRRPRLQLVQRLGVHHSSSW